MGGPDHHDDQVQNYANACLNNSVFRPCLKSIRLLITHFWSQEAHIGPLSRGIWIFVIIIIIIRPQNAFVKGSVRANENNILTWQNDP